MWKRSKCINKYNLSGIFQLFAIQDSYNVIGKSLNASLILFAFLIEFSNISAQCEQAEGAIPEHNFMITCHLNQI